MGPIATIGTRLVFAAARTFSAWRTHDTLALFAMFQSRVTASMQGTHRYCLGSGSSELHNSHFIATFPTPLENVSRPATHEISTCRAKSDYCRK
jgi:hypothetical protein